jgi:phosphopantetheine adenylyltransferase
MLDCERTYKVVIVFEIAAHGHLAGTVATRDSPFTPIICIYAPRRQIIAVGGHLALLAHHGVSVSHASFLVHGRVRARPDIGEAQRRMRGRARGSGRVVLLRRCVGCVFLLGRVRKRNVLLLGAHASWTRARVGVRRMRRWLRLVDGVGAGRERVLLSIARYLVLGRDHGGRRVCGGRPRALLAGTCCRLECVWYRLGRGPVLWVVWRGLLQLHVRRGIILRRIVHVLLRRRLARGCGRRRLYMELRVGRATQCRRSPRGIKAGLRGWGRRVRLLDGRLHAAGGLESVGSCARLAGRCNAQISHGRAYAAQCRRRLVDASRRVVRRVRVVVAERHGVAPNRQLQGLSTVERELAARRCGTYSSQRGSRAAVNVSVYAIGYISAVPLHRPTRTTPSARDYPSHQGLGSADSSHRPPMVLPRLAHIRLRTPLVFRTHFSVSTQSLADMASPSKRALLLLPPPPSPSSYASLKAAYNAPLFTVLKQLARSSSQPASLDIALPVPELYGKLDAPRGPLYSVVQQLVADLYKLICITATKESIDTEDAEGVDARVLLVAYPRNGQLETPPADSTPEQELQGPAVDLHTLARTPRSWNAVYSIESEEGERVLQSFLSLSGSPREVSRVRGGIVTVDKSATETAVAGNGVNHLAVAVGGTFDHLHIGHKLLLTMFAFVLGRRQRSEQKPSTLTVGITGDALLKNKKFAEQLESWKRRQESTHNFLSSIIYFGQPDDARVRIEEFNEPGPNGHALHVSYPFGLTIKYVEIWDPFGPTITDKDITALALSLETRGGGAAVNDKRREQGWDPLEVFEVAVLDASEENSVDESFQSKLSSTEIRRRRDERTKPKAKA